jgi:hypothetical protein
MAVLRVPVNVADRKTVCEGAALSVAAGEIVKSILKRLVGVAAVVTCQGRITEANQ